MVRTTDTRFSRSYEDATVIAPLRLVMSAITVDEIEDQQPAQQPEKAAEDAEVIDLTALSDGSSEEEDDGSGGDSSDDEEPVVDANSREELRVALKTVPAARLQEIIMALVAQIPAVERALTKEFVGPKARVLKRQREEDQAEAEGGQTERYIAGDDEECAFHPGMKLFSSFLLSLSRLKVTHVFLCVKAL